jgi:hypothetical protein
MAFGEPIFDGDVPTFNEARFTEALPETPGVGVVGGCTAVEKSHDRHRRLLRVRRERPRSRRAERG